MKLVDHYRLVERTSIAFVGGKSYMCLTIFFQVRIIRFQTFKPLVADGLCTMSHDAVGNQYFVFGCGFMRWMR